MTKKERISIHCHVFCYGKSTECGTTASNPSERDAFSCIIKLFEYFVLHKYYDKNNLSNITKEHYKFCVV